MAKPVLVGRVEQYKESMQWDTYIERLEIIFKVNKIEEADKAGVLLSYLSDDAYKTLRDLMFPAKPVDQTYKKIVDTMNAHCSPKPLVIAERYRFYNRSQHHGETVTQYLAELRKLASTCQFNDFLEEALRDRLVCGLLSENTQKTLLSQKDLTLQSATDLAVAAERAGKDAKELNAAATNMTIGDHNVHQMARQRPRRSANPQCYRCGKSNHNHRECYFKDTKCHKCGRVGHIKAMCTKSPRDKNDQRNQ